MRTLQLACGYIAVIGSVVVVPSAIIYTLVTDADPFIAVRAGIVLLIALPLGISLIRKGKNTNEEVQDNG